MPSKNSENYQIEKLKIELEDIYHNLSHIQWYSKFKCINLSCINFLSWTLEDKSLKDNNIIYIVYYFNNNYFLLFLKNITL